MALKYLVDVIERLFSFKSNVLYRETSVVTHPQRDAMLRYYDLHWVLQLFRHKIVCGRIDGNFQRAR